MTDNTGSSTDDIRAAITEVLAPTKNMLRIQMRCKDKSGSKWVEQFLPWVTYGLAPSDKTIDNLCAFIATHTDEVLDKVLSEWLLSQDYDEEGSYTDYSQGWNDCLSEVKAIIEKYISKPDDGKRG